MQISPQAQRSVNLECRFRGRRSTQSLPDQLRRGQGWAAAAFCVAGTALGESGVEISWQEQYAEPSGGAATRVVAAGPRLPFVWQAQHLVNPECR